MNEATFEDLKGKTLTRITAEKGGDTVLFECSDGERFELYHEQDCCERVLLEDIAGDLADLVGSPLLLAEESSMQTTSGFEDIDSVRQTITFYKLATSKGYVTLRWCGVSNGYYSERVDFRRLPT